MRSRCQACCRSLSRIWSNPKLRATSESVAVRKRPNVIFHEHPIGITTDICGECDSKSLLDVFVEFSAKWGVFGRRFDSNKCCNEQFAWYRHLHMRNKHGNILRSVERSGLNKSRAQAATQCHRQAPIGLVCFSLRARGVGW